jgi:hypothetical protein
VAVTARGRPDLTTMSWPRGGPLDAVNEAVNEAVSEVIAEEES